MNATGTGSVVTADIGAQLAGFTADVHFDAVDDVSDLKAVMGQNDAASYLTEANTITVDNDGSGPVVGAQDGAIQRVSQRMLSLMLLIAHRRLQLN